MRNEGSIHPTPKSTSDILGVLAIPLRELRDFDSRFVPAATDSTGTAQPAHVLSVCPVCGEAPGLELASGGVRVGLSRSLPPVLRWYCYSHRGSFDGIMTALVDHQAAKADQAVANLDTYPPAVSNLEIAEKRSIRRLDKDPVADHQQAYKCADPRRITHHFKALGRAQSTFQPCKKCVGCRAWRKAHRISRLKDAVSGWKFMRRTPALSPRQYAAMSRRIRRDGSDFVSVPTAHGRVVLTDSCLPVGEVVALADTDSTIEALVVIMLDDGRISGTVATRRKRRETKGKEKERGERIGTHKLDEAAEAAVYARFGCPKILLERGRGRGRRMWDVSSLSPDELLGLWSSLGIRVYVERMAA